MEHDDATNGGALVDLTPEVAKLLISNMAANSQQFGMRIDHTPTRVHEISTSSLEQRVEKLTYLIHHLIAGNKQQAKECGICSNISHPIDMSPILQEEPIQQANTIGIFPGPSQQKYDPYSNSYNPGWRNHPNFSYEN